MAMKFAELLSAIDAVASSRLGQASNESMQWLVDKAKELRRAALETTTNPRYTPSSERIVDELGSTATTDDDILNKKKNKGILKVGMFKLGDLVLFKYDAKTKAKLPYWDAFPVIFPIKFYPDGMLGINMHYLNPQMRAVLMDGLYGLITNTNMDETTRLNISYEILTGLSQLKAYRPCVKRYLFTHLQTQWFIIQPDQWEAVLFLPIARWQKGNEAKVWEDSLSAIK